MTTSSGITRREAAALALAGAGLGKLGLHSDGALASDGAGPHVPIVSGGGGDWEEELAYALGVQAYIFGFPYIYLPRLRWSWVTVPKPVGGPVPYAPLNQFHHMRNLVDASFRDGGSPNNDTLYSVSWLDLTKEPVILSHPNMGSRYFCFQLASLDSDNFAYVGKRATGSKSGRFAIVGPRWDGDLPGDVQMLARSRTNSALIVGRTVLNGPADLPHVRALQDKFELCPLSLMEQPRLSRPASRDVWQPANPACDPLAEWKTMNRAMAEDLLEERLAPLIHQFEQIGIGPGQNVDAQSEACKRGLVRAARDGRALLQRVAMSSRYGTTKNGWALRPAWYGRAGLHNDFLLRAAIQCLGGIVANDSAEAIYFPCTVDSEGQPLTGGKAYRMRFAAGALPDVKAFWSLSLYDETFNMVDNPANKYAVGDRTQGLALEKDGSLILAIQPDRPRDVSAANWLPSPVSGRFKLTFRTYLPGEPITSHQWAPPPVVPR